MINGSTKQKLINQNERDDETIKIFNHRIAVVF